MVSTGDTPQQRDRTRRRRLAVRDSDSGKSSRKSSRKGGSSRLAKRPSSSSTRSLTSSLESTANSLVRRRTKTKARKCARPAVNGSTSTSSSSGLPMYGGHAGWTHPGGWKDDDFVSPKVALRDGMTFRNVRRDDWYDASHQGINRLIDRDGTDDAPRVPYHFVNAHDFVDRWWWQNDEPYIDEPPVRRYGKHKGKPQGPAPLPVHPGKAASEGSRYTWQSNKKGRSRRQGTPSPSPSPGHETIGLWGEEDFDRVMQHEQERFEREQALRMWQEEEDAELNRQNDAGPGPGAG